jgi:hypothetical protein
VVTYLARSKLRQDIVRENDLHICLGVLPLAQNDLSFLLEVNRPDGLLALGVLDTQLKDALCLRCDRIRASLCISLGDVELTFSICFFFSSGE